MKLLRSRPFSGGNLADVIKYLRVDLAKIFADLIEGLRHLRFEDNFSCFIWEEEFGATETKTIPNRLRSPTVKWWPVRISGDARLVEAEPFTSDVIKIKNLSSTATKATLLFMR